MASISGISLNAYDNGAALGGVALFISSKARRTRLIDFRSDGWEVEVRAGSSFVVGRTDKHLPPQTLLETGIETAHRALDFVALLDGTPVVTRSPNAQHIIYHDRDNSGRRSIVLRSVCDLNFDVTANLTVVRADGTIEPTTVPPLPAWNVAYRFYRLSQSSRDLYEAFRSLFLGLEALLDQLFPKHASEGERAWLVRAVSSAGSKVNLSRFATSGAVDPAADVVQRIYDVRLKLFHAKTGRAIIPEDRTGYLEVADAYPLLLSLWSETVRTWLALSRGGGAVTNAGFKSMIESAYRTARAALSPTLPAGESDSIASHDLRGPWLVSTSDLLLKETLPGQMSLTGEFTTDTFTHQPLVGHVAIVDNRGEPLISCSIPGGLLLDKCDIFESAMTVRLRNSGSPKTEFG